MYLLTASQGDSRTNPTIFVVLSGAMCCSPQLIRTVFFKNVFLSS